MNGQTELDPDRYGSVGKLDDGRTMVRFERHLPYNIEQVWSAITEPAELERWFPGLTFEPRSGATYEIWFGGDCEGPAHVSGAVVAYDPPNELQLGTIRWQLSREPGGCLLVFTDVLHFDGLRTEQEFAHSVLGGWHRYLDLLEEALTGGPVDLDRPEPDYSVLDVARDLSG